MTTKTVTLRDFLTDREIIQAAQLWRKPGGQTAQRVANEIIRPNIDRINKALGQENDVMYLAYVVEYAIGEALHRQ